MRGALALFATLLAIAQAQYQQQRYNPQQQQQQQFQPQQQQYGNQQQQQQFNNQQRAQPGGQQGFQSGQQQQPNQYQQQQGFQNGQMSGRTGNMNGQPQQNPKTGRTVVVNTPTKLQSGVVGRDLATNGAQVDLRLSSYSNADLSLSNVTTCNCPVASCPYLSLTQQNSCSFSFTTVISARDQSVQYIQSDFYPFAGQISSGNWTQPYSFQMTSKPVAIDVFVQHLGVVIDKLSASLLFFNHLTLVDSFVVDMSKYTPGLNNVQTYTLTGLQMKTQLQMTLAVQCINGMMGDMCDLSCPTSNNDYVVCTDSEGRNTSCRWNNYKNSVTECQICTEIGANGTCATLIQTNQVGISSAYRTWTIVLGSLLGIAVLVILCLIIAYIISRIKNKESEEEVGNQYRRNEEYKTKPAARPLLDDEWSAPPPRRGTEASRHPADDSYIQNGHSSNRQEHQV